VFRDIRMPFGSRKSGETARQTAARETLEETGLDVTVSAATFIDPSEPKPV